MIRKILVCAALCMGISLSASSAFSAEYANCAPAVPNTDVNFCSSMKESARCHCTASGLPAPVCQDVNQLYNRLISMFGSLQRICEYQHETTTQNCIDEWNCYRLGGTDSHGGLCSSTGKSCQ